MIANMPMYLQGSSTVFRCVRCQGPLYVAGPVILNAHTSSHPLYQRAPSRPTRRSSVTPCESAAEIAADRDAAIADPEDSLEERCAWMRLRQSRKRAQSQGGRKKRENAA